MREHFSVLVFAAILAIACEDPTGSSTPDGYPPQSSRVLRQNDVGVLDLSYSTSAVLNGELVVTGSPHKRTGWISASAQLDIASGLPLHVRERPSG